MNALGILLIMAGCGGAAITGLVWLTTAAGTFNLHNGFMQLLMLIASVGLGLAGTVFVSTNSIVAAIKSGDATK